jgi:DeoR family transcriptional regulator, fructose operon transcriptional repressor
MTSGDGARRSAEARRSRVLELVRTRSEIDIGDLAAETQATQATLRRDLRLLEAQGLVRRSYGRIAAVESSRFETPLAWRAAVESVERAAIAAAAAREVGDASSVFVDEGVTGQLVAANLPPRPLTIVTPSLPVAAELAATTSHEILLLGGRVRGRTLGSVDHWARDMLAGFAIDLAFIGANGVTMEAGLTTPDPAVAAVKAVAVKVSRRVVFVGDHTKFGVTSFARFANVADVEVFVTSDRLSASQARRFAQHGARVERVAL